VEPSIEEFKAELDKAFEKFGDDLLHQFRKLKTAEAEAKSPEVAAASLSMLRATTDTLTLFALIEMGRLHQELVEEDLRNDVAGQGVASSGHDKRIEELLANYKSLLDEKQKQRDREKDPMFG
jgi:hypothetical protein